MEYESDEITPRRKCFSTMELDCSYWMRDAFRTATYSWKNICPNRRCRQLLNVSIRQRQFFCVASRAKCLLTSAVILTILNDLLTHFQPLTFSLHISEALNAQTRLLENSTVRRHLRALNRENPFMLFINRKFL